MFGVLDTMQSIKPPIQTLGLGACYSYASLILVRAWLCVCVCAYVSVCGCLYVCVWLRVVGGKYIWTWEAHMYVRGCVHVCVCGRLEVHMVEC